MVGLVETMLKLHKDLPKAPRELESIRSQYVTRKLIQ